MSALGFTRRHRASSRSTPEACLVRPCNGTGLYRWEILGHPQGLVCSKHRNELQRVWSAAREATDDC